MNELIVFTKLLKQKSLNELARIGRELELDGYDLCIRQGYPVNPDNISEELVKAVEKMKQSGLKVPMVTASLDLVTPDQPSVEPILKAMDQADIRLIKLGYFSFNPATQDYWPEVDRIRRAFAGWEKLGRQYQVKICYHTHSNRCMGLNCAALMHLIRGFDPQYIGAYIDPLHMAAEGEEFPVGLAMVKEYLSIVALKDLYIHREEINGHGSKKLEVVPSGEGMVDFTSVFTALRRVEFQGPLSMHCEFEDAGEEELLTLISREVAYFKDFQARYLGK
jgi:sugar phosphate isomerase/epimerase